MMDNQERLKVVATPTCIEPGCGKTFNITKGEKEFYESKGMLLPKRCPSCRLRRRTSIKTTMQIPLSPETKSVQNGEPS